jgi:transcriptional regulator GlxA family with amidase domain
MRATNPPVPDNQGRHPTGQRRRVGILVFDHVTLLDVAGPREVFTDANRFGADYHISLYSPDGHEVVASTGMRFSVDAAAACSGA